MSDLFDNSYSSQVRPMLRGRRGAIAAAHPLATAAGQQMFERGGNAADAVIAAQAVLCVIAPNSCGLGGDLLALVNDADGETVAVSATGAAPAGLVAASHDGANSVTVPGIVSGWECMARRWAHLPLAILLGPAIEIATQGFALPTSLMLDVEAQRVRLLAGGAGEWILLKTAAGDHVTQPHLGGLLRRIAADGAAAFYQGDSAAAIERAIARGGGTLNRHDLAAHSTELRAAITVSFGAWRVAVQPPPTQGILLAMALAALDAWGANDAPLLDHLCVELTEAAFAYRARSAEGSDLLAIPLEVDPARAARRGGPRAYLHTAGVAAADATGMTVSSLVSVFDDFGSCIFVPELGLTLNNRAAGFTDGPNAAAPGKRPVHTLAPILLSDGARRIGLATPGADGQVQTLLQILAKLVRQGTSLPHAVSAPRWRSEGGALLVEEGHPHCQTLARRGHDTMIVKAGDTRFGAIVCAAFDEGPAALADWRRECWAGIA
ncbi:MAG TPA: gamma-glutamyltransferase [Sphingomonas sp.]|nr:gamma-glutamyltransferase [Sphingomonas sp.]